MRGRKTSTSPTKTTKQISDKRQDLHKSPVKKGKDQGRKEHLELEGEHLAEGEHLVCVGSEMEGGLRSHYRKTISERVTSGKLSILHGMFQRVIEGEEDLTTVADKAMEDCFARLAFKSSELKAGQGRPRQVAQTARPSEPPKGWMKKRAVKRGQFLRFQRLFYLDRGKLAGIILDDMESLTCGIPQDEIPDVFKSRWESPGTFKGLGAFRSRGQADNSAFEAMITAKEISKNIKEMNKNSAPGPD